MTDKSNRLSYLYGVMINRQGRRFLDEGEDFRDHTYVKFSKFVVEQAGGDAWCIFDQKAYQREEFARAWRPRTGARCSPDGAGRVAPS